MPNTGDKTIGGPGAAPAADAGAGQGNAGDGAPNSGGGAEGGDNKQGQGQGQSNQAGQGAGAGQGNGTGNGASAVKLPERRAAKFIIQRKNETIDKLRGQGNDKTGDGSGSGQGGTGDGTGDGAGDNKPTGMTQEQIDEALRQQNAPVIDALKADADDRDISDHLKEFADHAEFVPQVREIMKQPGYEQVALPVLFKALAYDKLAASIAKGEVKKQAAESGVGSGSTARDENAGELPNAWDMTPEQFEAAKRGVTQRK